VQHKQIFSFLICTQIMRQQGEIADAEWAFLLRGSSPPNP
jgi:dynein heavy chain